ncbi:monofunctional biosynthetic peptidoglycan transglycosylase [Cognatishimia activa]|uniref:monofunctional biosynthetic peptidoglycan transglycosylase n=1 Tax=Cognatishimia activa TaxID=1715691 RepID=UPI002231E1F4|nr:monofunctional biosynthetic peptidoglycan transglycosylase [Cognatishimia activa]UZD90776.1 monofunctional biosynthetic peptidoglycan transglycosylase [Cognatishimia activa]
MAKTAKKTKKKNTETWRQRQGKRLRRAILRSVVWGFSLFIFAVLIFTLFNPPTTWTMYSENSRLGRLDHQWVPIEEIAPVMARSVVAAEDANFCDHWGFDVNAIRAAIEDGASRGASTISQQVVKNVYLWQGRSWVRKALETGITPFVEMAWSKRRILEVYLNVAEFDEGVFGIEAASRHYFGVGPEDLSASQAARLATVLPNPKGRSASRPSQSQIRRASSIMDGAATIDRDGRAACFQ